MGGLRTFPGLIVGLVAPAGVVLSSCAADLEFPTARNPAHLAPCPAKTRADLGVDDSQLHAYRAILWSFVEQRWEILKADPVEGIVWAKVCTREKRCLLMRAQATVDGTLKLYCPEQRYAVSPARRWSWFGHLRNRFEQRKCFTAHYLKNELQARGYPVARSTPLAEPKSEGEKR